MRVDVDQHSLPVDGDWISVSELARRRNVTRQAISKRVKALSASGRLSTQGRGKALRVHLPTFDALVAAAHDPAQDLRNRHIRAPEPAREIKAESPAPCTTAPAQQSSLYDDAAAREKNAKAAIAEMELAKRRGELVPARAVEAAAIKAATTIAQMLSSLKTKAGQLYAAGHKGGEEALHIVLVESINSVQSQIADAMANLATLGAADDAD